MHPALVHNKDRCALLYHPWTQRLFICQRWQLVCGCVCVCILIYHMQCFRNHTLPCKIVKMVAAYCYGCNGVAMNRIRYKMTVTLRDGAVSDLHVTRTAVVASFRSGDTWLLLSQKRWMASWIQWFMCWMHCCLATRGEPSKNVVHAYVVIMSVLYVLKTDWQGCVY